MHSRTHLEHLLLIAMQRMVPAEVYECRRLWQEQGRKGEPDRTALLEHLLHRFGTQRFLALCQAFPSYVPATPFMLLLYNSATPGALIRKISLHAPHFHPTRRLELVEEGQYDFVVEDIILSGKPPVPADDMFIYSTIRGVLHEYGCRGLQVEWEAVRSTELHRLLSHVGIHPIAIEQFTRWRYRWERIEHPATIKGLDEFFLDQFNTTHQNPSAKLTHQIQQLLTKNISRRPPIEEIASELGLSTRTLQRKLRAEGTSYAMLHNDLRIKTAERILRTTSMTLSEVSRLSGFTDSAHLCREFRKKHSISPGKYRRGS